jgi:hypothetical protein
MQLAYPQIVLAQDFDLDLAIGRPISIPLIALLVYLLVGHRGVKPALLARLILNLA